MKLSNARLLAAGGVAAALLVSLVSVHAADEKKTYTTKDIMKKLPNRNGLVAKVADLGKAGKWDDAAKLSKDIKEHGAALSSNKPKKGDAKSWEEMAKKYADNTAAIDAAIGKKDATTLAAEVTTFNGMCKSCHTAHK